MGMELGFSVLRDSKRWGDIEQGAEGPNREEVTGGWGEIPA
jgi:hypothetical protein